MMTDTLSHLPMNHLSSSFGGSSMSSDTHDQNNLNSSSLLLPRFNTRKQSKKPYVSPSMQGYQQKMKLAQASKGICYGSGQNVGRMPLKHLLLGPQQAIENPYQMDTQIPIKFQVPIFQRRYCWTETQWQTLLMDAATTKSEDGLHSLGRLTCTNQNSSSSVSAAQEEKVAHDDERSVILDGQQRFTTVTLLLAAIRDTMYKRQQRSIQKNLTSFDHKKATQIIQEIDQILFPDQDEYQQWLGSSSVPELKEGMELKFAKLIPTYCDRWSYYSAILPQHHTQISNRLLNTSTEAAAFHRPLAAKKYYDGMLATFSNGEVFNLLDGLYHKLTMLLFPIELSSANRTDGTTEDLMVVYERLAIRDATYCKPTRSDEYVTMSGLDMIRNAMLGSFATEPQALDFYQSYWLPMERMAATSVNKSNADGEKKDQQNQEEEEDQNLQSMMLAFLDHENLEMKEEEEKLEEGTVGGMLYTRFQLWQDRMVASGVSLSAEQATRQQGEAMLAFAKGYFQS